MAGMKTDMAGMKTDMAGMKTDMAGMKTDMAGMNGKLDLLVQLIQEQVAFISVSPGTTR